MRCLVHISDLHFGKARPDRLKILKNEILATSPDLLIVSGDLTQRATSAQFQEARDFLHSLPFQKLVVPGNHDIPLWNVFLRFLDPLARYQKTITPNLSPSYEDERISVQGITTAHGRTIAGGRFHSQDLERIIRHWESLPANVIRILVSHHPFESLPSVKRTRRPGYRIQLPPDVSLAEHADLILSGPSVRPQSFPSERVMITPERSIVAIQTGTATSSRHHGEPNSYNRLRISNGEIEFDKRSWDVQTEAFVTEKSKRFFTRSTTSSPWSQETAQNLLQL